MRNPTEPLAPPAPPDHLAVVHDTAPAQTVTGPDPGDGPLVQSEPVVTATVVTAPVGFGSVMTRWCRVGVGVGNVAGGGLALVAVLWSYDVAERMVVAQEGLDGLARQTVMWWGPPFAVTLSTSLVLAGAAAGFLGSLVQQSIVFASRAGAGTLESAYLWWYVLRPVWSALLGAVVVLTVNAGLVSIGDESTSQAGLTVLVTSAAVAGLFTDQALQRLRTVLGASDPAGPGT